MTEKGWNRLGHALFTVWAVFVVTSIVALAVWPAWYTALETVTAVAIVDWVLQQQGSRIKPTTSTDLSHLT